MFSVGKTEIAFTKVVNKNREVEMKNLPQHKGKEGRRMFTGNCRKSFH
jgi:hypothetical protein